jgi:hypothetical protein
MGHLLNQSPWYIQKLIQIMGVGWTLLFDMTFEKISSFWKEKVNLAKLLLGKTP